MSYTFLTAIIPDAVAEDTRAMWIALDGAGGDGMFRREVRKTDGSVWRLSSGAMNDPMGALIQDPAALASACADVGYALDLAGATALLSGWVIDERTGYEGVLAVLADNDMYFPPEEA